MLERLHEMVLKQRFGGAVLGIPEYRSQPEILAANFR